MRLVSEKEEGYITGFIWGISVGMLIGYYLL